MLLKKQTCFEGQWALTLDFEPKREGEEAGVAIWWSKWSYVSLGVQLRAGSGEETEERELVFRHSDPKTEDPVFVVSQRSARLERPASESPRAHPHRRPG